MIAAPAADEFVVRLLATDAPAERRTLIEQAPCDPDLLRETVLRLDSEATRLSGADPRRMERICDDMLALADRAGNDYLRAVALRRAGDASQRLLRSTEARDRYERAAGLFTALGMPVDAARTRIGWANVVAELGEFETAVAGARAARRVLLQHGETARVAGLEQTLGTIHAAHGDNRTALRYLRSARTRFESLGESAALNVARCRANIGLLLSRLGRHRAALAELEAARESYERLGERAGYARVSRSIAENQMRLGNYAAALRAFEAARTDAARLGLDTAAATIVRDIAECYLQLNRPADALAAIDAIADQIERAGLPLEAFSLASRRVVAFQQLGRHDDAVEALARAARWLDAAPLQSRAWLHLQRAALLARTRTPDRTGEEIARARALARAAGARRLVAESWVIEADTLLRTGDVAGAARCAARARRLARAIDADPILHRAYEILGRVAEAQARPAVARRRYATAVAHLEREQRGVIFDFRDGFAVGRHTAYERLASLELDTRRPARALLVAERAKSRALVEALSGAISIRPPTHASPTARRLVRELAAAREQYALALHRRREREGGAEGSALTALRVSTAPPAAPEDDLPAIEARIAALIRRLQVEGAAGAAPASGEAPVTLPRIADGSLLIEFFFSGDDILRFTLAGGRVRGDRLPGAVTVVQRQIRAVQLALDATAAAHPGGPSPEQTARVRRLLSQLADCLLDGVDGLDRCRSLVVVPHGILHGLPFHALIRNGSYLVEQMAVSYAPSATLYHLCRTRTPVRRRGAVVLAHSAGGALPHALAEGVTVGAVLGAPVHAEERATRRVLETEGRRAAILHIAAHGSFRADAPLFSSIELAGTPLTTADIFGLSLRAALVTLSACETGRAVVGGGDELAGMARAFLFAGAASLLVSQWRVDDASTAALMTAFYSALTAGAARDEALRAAQRSLIDAATPQNGRDHPFYWAGFQIVGDGGPIGHDRTH